MIVFPISLKRLYKRKIIQLLKRIFNIDKNVLNMAKHHPDLIFCRKQPGVGKYAAFYKSRHSLGHVIK